MVLRPATLVGAAVLASIACAGGAPTAAAPRAPATGSPAYWTYEVTASAGSRELSVTASFTGETDSRAHRRGRRRALRRGRRGARLGPLPSHRRAKQVLVSPRALQTAVRRPISLSTPGCCPRGERRGGRARRRGGCDRGSSVDLALASRAGRSRNAVQVPRDAGRRRSVRVSGVSPRRTRRAPSPEPPTTTTSSPTPHSARCACAISRGPGTARGFARSRPARTRRSPVGSSLRRAPSRGLRRLPCPPPARPRAARRRSLRGLRHDDGNSRAAIAIDVESTVDAGGPSPTTGSSCTRWCAPRSPTSRARDARSRGRGSPPTWSRLRGTARASVRGARLGRGIDGMPIRSPRPATRGSTRRRRGGARTGEARCSASSPTSRSAERTNNPRSLGDALRAVLAAGGNIAQSWTSSACSTPATRRRAFRCYASGTRGGARPGARRSRRAVEEPGRVPEGRRRRVRRFGATRRREARAPVSPRQLARPVPSRLGAPSAAW